ncbi:hypothetical protein TNCV_2208021 [Trichonephila clavipes]|uniref:Uncharacterized protein n=1 Tax=Trichonephila clavipes TaxID=2585209 RepID=A0A8X6S0S7_TRICX|nr:hypothetical protein TNCV_2208021 [Trichonephila clavipes]
MSSFLVLSEGDTRNRWLDGQVCPDVGQGTMAPRARRPGRREEKKREKTWRFGGCGVEAPGSDKKLFYGGCWCKSQNANESLHSVIWSHCPKESFQSKKRLEISVVTAVSEFNFGSLFTLKHVHQNASLPSMQISGVRDERRLKQSRTTRRLLAMDLVILNHGQVTRTTTELAPPPLTFIPTGGRFSLNRFNVQQPLCTAGLQQFQARTRDTPVTSPLP